MAGFGSINDIKKGKEDEDEDTNKYYVGGNDGKGGGSGQAVLAPNKDKDKNKEKDAFQKLIEQAKKDGKEKPIEEGENKVKITLYKNGFMIGEDDFRSKESPENQEFIKMMENGICPPELMTNGQPPAIDLKDKSSEVCKPKFRAFTGAGTAIGKTKLDFTENDVISVEGAAEKPEVNEKEKTVRVQIRYPDGKRQAVKFNVHHIVNDLISVIRTSGRVNSAFVLQDVKKKVITESSFRLSITEAGLASSVVLVNTSL